MAIFVGIVFFGSKKVSAQGISEITYDEFYWLRITPDFHLANDWRITAEFEARRFAFESRQHQYLIPRLTLLKKINRKVSLGAGYTHFLQAVPQNSDQSIVLIRPELRDPETHYAYYAALPVNGIDVLAMLLCLIGIGLIGSFAAREVLVSTLGLVYGIENADEDDAPLRDVIREAETEEGEPRYTKLSGLALMVFFVYACQCMSTLAVVRRETRSWKWPIFMLVSMTAIAYLAALLVFQLGGMLV